MGVDWGEVLGGALASGIAGWSEGAISEAKAEREAARQEGLKEIEIAWEKEKIDLQKEANKELKQQEINANAEITKAAAERAAKKEEKDDAWEQKKWASDQEYKEKSLDIQSTSANKTAAEVQLMEYLDNKGLLGSYLDQKTGANKGESAIASAYSSYMGKATDNGEDALPYSDFKNKYYGSGSTSGSSDSQSTNLLNPASIAQRAKERAAAAKKKTTEEPDLMSGH